MEKNGKESKITEESVNLVRAKYEASLKQLRAKRDVDLTNCKDAIALLSDVIVQTRLTKEILQLKLDIANQIHQDYFVPSTSPVAGGTHPPFMYAQLIRDVDNDPATETLFHETLAYNRQIQPMSLRCGEWVQVLMIEGKVWTCQWPVSSSDERTLVRASTPSKNPTPRPTPSFRIPFWDRKTSPTTPTLRRGAGPRSLSQRPSEFLNLEDVHIEEDSPENELPGDDPRRNEESNRALFVVLAEWCKVHDFLGDLHSRINKAGPAQLKQVLTLLAQQQALPPEGHEDHVCQSSCSRPCHVRQDEKEKARREDKSYRYKEQTITQLFKEFGQFDFSVFNDLLSARMSLRKQIDALGTESGDGGQLKELWDKREVWNLWLQEAEDRWQAKEAELQLLRDRAVAARERTLIAACERCDFAQVEDITSKAKHKAKLVNELDHGNGPLHVACLRGDTKIAHFLLMSSADPMLVDESKGDTPLHYAARSGEVALMGLLLEYWNRKQRNTGNQHSFINARGRKGRTPLDTASHFSNKNAVKWLLSEGATASVSDDDTQRTPLHSAARQGSVAITNLLINAGGNPFAQNSNGETPLFTAVYYGHLKLVKFYVDQGAWLTAQERKVLVQRSDENKKIVFVLTTVLNDQMAALRGEIIPSSSSAN